MQCFLRVTVIFSSNVSPGINDNGYLVFAGAFKDHESFSANETKAEAIICALMKANELGFSNIQTFFSELL